MTSDLYYAIILPWTRKFYKLFNFTSLKKKINWKKINVFLIGKSSNIGTRIIGGEKGSLSSPWVTMIQSGPCTLSGRRRRVHGKT